MEDIVLFGTLAYQNGRKLITGFIMANDLISIHKLDKWEPGKPVNEQGAQREPIPTHYKKIGKNMKENNGVMPTSILLSTIQGQDEKIIVEEIINNRVVKITLKKGAKLKILDGMHRTLASEYAIYTLKAENLKDFNFPFVILYARDRVDEILAFFEINSKAKKVATDLALQLLNEINKHSDINLTKTEKWKLIALNVAMKLNEKPESVWFENISVGHSKGDEIASSTSFVTSLKPILEIGFIKNIWNDDSKSEIEAGAEIAGFVDLYWNAIRDIIPEAFPEIKEDKHSWVIQKTPGFYSWHMVAPVIIQDYIIDKFGVTNIKKEHIKSLLENYGGEFISKPHKYWIASNKDLKIAGGIASKANSQKAFKELFTTMETEIRLNYEQANKKSIKWTY
ncbi:MULTISPECIES: DGQHR domain-containing protein [Priestia]|uniref:DGQHR domain-containing protein n=1 Tax=Priestia TaxID=2800373 RepID=UPI00237FD956|nr:DGQHR domain-containing protein [Priestia aryabhattai]WDW09257.1 DGQHR domain-containing protein [Priestia aryabhattai]